MPDQTFSEELYNDTALKEAVDRMANLIKTHATKAYVDEKVAEAGGDSIDALSEAVSELKENLSESASDLKSALNETDVFTRKVADSVADFNGELITATSVDSGKFIRFVNGAWQEISNQYWIVYEYPVEEETVYRVTGSKGQYTPMVIFANSSGSYIHSTEIALDFIGNYQRGTQIIATPKECTKIIVNQFNGVSAVCELVSMTAKTTEKTNALNIATLLNWEEGGITNGQNSQSDTRIRTTQIYRFDYPVAIPVNDSVKIGIWAYDDFSFTSNPTWGGWVSDDVNSYVIPKGTYFRLLTYDGGIAKKDCIHLYNNDFMTINVYDYKLPIKWRHGMINNNGVMYFSLNGLISDLLIPTIICDYAIKHVSDSQIGLCYYDYVDGAVVFNKRVDIPSANQCFEIDKRYPFVAIVVFVSWTTQLQIADAETYVTLHYLPTEEKQVKNICLYNVIRNANSRNDGFIWSICHQGYSDSGLGHNLRGGYARAASRGFTHGECDIKLTSDNQLVCSHDPSFVDSVTGETIVIADHTLAELQEHSYFGGVISTLADIISECKRSGIGLFIDQVDDNNATYAVSTAKELNALTICYFMSRNVQTLSNIITIDNNAKIVYLTYLSTAVADVLPSLVSLNHELIYDAGQYVPEQLTNVQEIAKALPGNIRLMLWTIDNTEYITELIPYINGWTSNAISGRDVFNPQEVIAID